MTLGLAALCAPAKAARDDQHYVNQRYAYHLTYPANLLRPQALAPASATTPEDGGRRFADASGRVTLAVWGMSNLAGASLQEMAQSLRRQCSPRGKVQMSVDGDRAVLACAVGHDMVYEKIIGNHSRFAFLRLSYPATQNRRWEPRARTIGASFEFLKPSARTR